MTSAHTSPPPLCHCRHHVRAVAIAAVVIAAATATAAAISAVTSTVSAAISTAFWLIVVCPVTKIGYFATYTYGTYLPVPCHNIVTTFQLIPVGLLTFHIIIYCGISIILVVFGLAILRIC